MIHTKLNGEIKTSREDKGHKSKMYVLFVNGWNSSCSSSSYSIRWKTTNMNTQRLHAILEN